LRKNVPGYLLSVQVSMLDQGRADDEERGSATSEHAVLLGKAGLICQRFHVPEDILNHRKSRPSGRLFSGNE
jgi:hypothetical protein